MANNFTLSALTERFPLGCEVINLGSIKAEVVGYNDHGGCGQPDLLLAECKPSGRLSRSRWTANPAKCQRV